MKNKQMTFRSILQRLKKKNMMKGLKITYQVTWNLFLVFIVFGLMAAFFIGGAGAGFFASLVKDEPLRTPDEIEQAIYNYTEMSEVYFAHDLFLGELPAELERREVGLENVSEYLIQAVVATEDEYFYEHDGIVPKALLRATYQELSNSAVQTGGSTLTQQLVKNQILSNEVSFDRKAKEIVLAMRLEKFFDKGEILEAYLNVVPFGRNASGRQIAGVQAAAQGIFGVDVQDLTLPQAAYIAGLPQSPFGYTPFTNQGEIKDDLDAGLNRMETVLKRMQQADYISEADYEEALQYDIRANLTTRTPSLVEEYPYLTYETERRATDILTQQRIEREDIDLDNLSQEERLEIISSFREQARRELRRNGYEIHTTVNKDIYDAMQLAIQDDRLVGPDKEGELEEVGSILIENQTGAILGFVGGRDFSKQNLNHATQAWRSNGSTMKPLLAYAPALEIGAIQPGRILPDTPMEYSDGSSLSNFDNRHRGLLTVREALQSSRNIPAVRAFQKVPHDVSRSALLNMGFRLTEQEPYESAAIGALANGVTVEINTNAFATLANGGQFVDSHLIERIETRDGEVIYEHDPKPVNVFSPETSYLMIDMLRDVLRPGGTASSLPRRLSFNSDWAGKTGTTNDYHDAWFVGTNPNVSLGVWIGYDTPKRIKRTVNGMSYSQRTQQIWANIANAAYDVQPDLIGPNQQFERPNGVVQQSICAISGLLPSPLCEEAGLTRSDLFNVNHIPTKIDDSLERTRYVTIDDERYIALESTPEEFTNEGIMIAEAYFDDQELLDYLPQDWDNLLPKKTMEDNGKKPGVITGIDYTNGQLRWSEHLEPDIIGYRIYRSKQGRDPYVPFATIIEKTTTTYSGVQEGHSYSVTAIDIAGQESTYSDSIDLVRQPPEEKEYEKPGRDRLDNDNDNDELNPNFNKPKDTKPKDDDDHPSNNRNNNNRNNE